MLCTSSPKRQIRQPAIALSSFPWQRQKTLETPVRYNELRARVLGTFRPQGNTYRGRRLRRKYTRMCRVMWFRYAKASIGHSSFLLCPLWGLVDVCDVSVRLEDACPHAWALWTETLSSLGTTARSLLAKILLDRKTRAFRSSVLGGLQPLRFATR